jgi:hypothetical protein
LIDYDVLETENLFRHVLPVQYLGWNKAEGMAVYLAEQVSGLKTEAVPRRIDSSVSDELLDKWLSDADLIVGATDDRDAQRRIGRRALLHEVPAIFPALYIDGRGEVIIQADSRLPCFGCWDYFRGDTEQLRGPRMLDHAGQPVIYTSVSLSLGILNPDSEHREMMKGDNPAEPLNQVFILDGAGILNSGILPRRSDCPSCAVPPPLRQPPTPPSPPPHWRPPPGYNTPDRPPVVETTHDSSWRGVAVVGIIMVLIVIVALARSGGGDNSASSYTTLPAKTPQQIAAEAATKRQIAAERKIARLSFQCIDRYVCENDPAGHALPVFVNGMDENLRTYLEKQGYKDEWTDSVGGIHGQTIGPNSRPEGVFAYRYVSTSHEQGGPANENEPNNVETGMLYQEQGEHGNSEATGILPWDVTGNAVWIVTWKLIDPSGKIVKALRYLVHLVTCEGTGEAYCEQVRNYEDEARPGETVAQGDTYSTKRYVPPLAFDKPSEEGE